MSSTWQDRVILFKLNLKIHKSLMNKEFSFYFEHKLSLANEPLWPFEKYIEARAILYDAIADTDLEPYSFYIRGGDDHTNYWFINRKTQNWRSFYEVAKRVKRKILRESKNLVHSIERDYLRYEKTLYLQRVSPIRRVIKSCYKLWKEHRNRPERLFTRKEKARDRFFNKKWKERQKFVFKYFIKGLINWVFYICFKKVIFTKIVELEEQQFVIRYKTYRRYRDMVPRISSSLYFASDLEKIPPQLWLLAILYELYYHGVVFYLYQENVDYHHREYSTSPKNIRAKRRIKTTWGYPELSTLGIIHGMQVRFAAKAFFNTSKKKIRDFAAIYINFMLERQSRETLDTQNKTWFDVSSKFAETYYVENEEYEDKHDFDIGILPFEGRQDPETDNKIRGIVDFIPIENQSSELKALIFNLESLSLAKSALQLKLSFESMRADNAYKRQIKEDVHEQDKKDIFHAYQMDYSEDLGKRFWLDVEDRQNTRWYYENHVIKFDTMEGIRFETARSLNAIWEHLTTIYYQLTLNELTYNIENSIIIKNKCIKFTNISAAPSLYYNLNYSNYPNFNTATEASKNRLDDYTKGLYASLKKTWNKKIVYPRNEDLDWVVKADEYEDIYTDSTQNTTTGEFAFYYNMNSRTTYLLDRKKNYYKSKRKKEERFAYQLLLNDFDIAFVWNVCISKRFISTDTFKHTFEQYLLDSFWIDPWRDAQDSKRPLFFFNIAKFSWMQWVGFDLIEKERLALYNKNTIIIHELYNIWNLKLEPLRIKLPIMLEFKKEKLINFREHFKEVMRGWDENNYYLPWTSFRKILGRSIVWHQYKQYLREETNIKEEEVLMWLIAGDISKFNKFNLNFQQAEGALLDDMLKFDYMQLETSMKISWDIMQYWKIFADYAEDFNHTDWFQMRIRSYSRSDFETIELQDDYKFIQYKIFRPVLFHFWFNRQRYMILSWKYMGIFCSSFIFYEIFFCPGEILYNIWYIILPGIIGILSFINYFFLRKYVNEFLKARDIYLYKYQSTRKRPLTKKVRKWWHYDEDHWDAIQKEAGYNGREVKWQLNNFRYVKNRLLTVRSMANSFNILIISWFIAQYLELQMWRAGKLRGFDYYPRDKETGFINSYQDQVWARYDEDRNEGGGSIQNLWYMNIYRKKKIYQKLKYMVNMPFLRSYLQRCFMWNLEMLQVEILIN